MFFRKCIERMIYTACAVAAIGCDGVEESKGLAEDDDAADKADDDDAVLLDGAEFDLTKVPDVARGGCPSSRNISVGGGQAIWTLTCVGDHIYMTGYVKDMAPDFKCAHMKAVFSDGSVKTKDACGLGTRADFSWSGPGKLADGYLSVW